MANAVVKWFEIMGEDGSALHRFYQDVFSWKMTPPAKEMGNYAMLEDHEPGIGGGIGDGPARVSVYIAVAEPQSYLDRALKNGAQLLMPVTEIVPGTTIAMFTDPAGNTIGLMKEQPPEPRTATRRTTARRAAGARKTKTGGSRTKTAARKKKPAARTRTASRPTRRTRRPR